MKILQRKIIAVWSIFFLLLTIVRLLGGTFTKFIHYLCKVFGIRIASKDQVLFNELTQNIKDMSLDQFNKLEYIHSSVLEPNRYVSSAPAMKQILLDQANAILELKKRLKTKKLTRKERSDLDRKMKRIYNYHEQLAEKAKKYFATHYHSLAQSAELATQYSTWRKELENLRKLQLPEIKQMYLQNKHFISDYDKYTDDTLTIPISEDLLNNQQQIYSRIATPQTMSIAQIQKQKNDWPSIQQYVTDTQEIIFNGILPIITGMLLQYAHPKFGNNLHDGHKVFINTCVFLTIHLLSKTDQLESNASAKMIFTIYRKKMSQLLQGIRDKNYRLDINTLKVDSGLDSDQQWNENVQKFHLLFQHKFNFVYNYLGPKYQIYKSELPLEIVKNDLFWGLILPIFLSFVDVMQANDYHIVVTDADKFFVQTQNTSINDDFAWIQWPYIYNIVTGQLFGTKLSQNPEDHQAKEDTFKQEFYGLGHDRPQLPQHHLMKEVTESKQGFPATEQLIGSEHAIDPLSAKDKETQAKLKAQQAAIQNIAQQPDDWKIEEEAA